MDDFLKIGACSHIGLISTWNSTIISVNKFSKSNALRQISIEKVTGHPSEIWEDWKLRWGNSFSRIEDATLIFYGGVWLL